MTGGYLRTNFTRTGQQQMTAIGGGYPQTSYASAAGLGQPYNGFIMGSVVMNSVSAVSISALGAMSAWFGDGHYNLSGYCIKVISIMPRFIASISTTDAYLIWASCGSAGNSIIIFVAGGSQSALVDQVASAEFEWAGFIVSGP